MPSVALSVAPNNDHEVFVSQSSSQPLENLSFSPRSFPRCFVQICVIRLNRAEVSDGQPFWRSGTHVQALMFMIEQCPRGWEGGAKVDRLGWRSQLADPCAGKKDFGFWRQNDPSVSSNIQDEEWLILAPPMGSWSQRTRNCADTGLNRVTGLAACRRGIQSSTHPGPGPAIRQLDARSISRNVVSASDD
jgi:hypothetical protein